MPTNTKAAPPIRLLLAETRLARDWARARLKPSVADALRQGGQIGDDAPIITLPGFCAGDMSMGQMRKNLRAAGFRARGWGMGTNLGAQVDTLDRIGARVRDVATREGRPVHLVGWSLGGVMAREFAKANPDHVASVITMGSPFSGSRHANHAWRLYRLVAGHSVDNPPIGFHPAPKPEVPTYAIWSRNDGVIAIDSARGHAEESDRMVELECGHFGFAYVDEAVNAVIDCVVEAEHLRHESAA